MVVSSLLVKHAVNLGPDLQAFPRSSQLRKPAIWHLMQQIVKLPSRILTHFTFYRLEETMTHSEGWALFGGVFTVWVLILQQTERDAVWKIRTLVLFLILSCCFDKQRQNWGWNWFSSSPSLASLYIAEKVSWRKFVYTFLEVDVALNFIWRVFRQVGVETNAVLSHLDRFVSCRQWPKLGSEGHQRPLDWQALCGGTSLFHYFCQHNVILTVKWCDSFLNGRSSSVIFRAARAVFSQASENTSRKVFFCFCFYTKLWWGTRFPTLRVFGETGPWDSLSGLVQRCFSFRVRSGCAWLSTFI